MRKVRKQLIELIREGQFEEAYIYFVEHKKELPFLERRLLFHMIEDGLEQRKNDMESRIVV